MNHIAIPKSKSKVNTRMLTVTALLAAISFILAYVEFPILLSPSFARMDFSDFPALIAAFAYGPIVGLMVELVKNALQLLSTSTGGIGELANFIMEGSFVLTSGVVYKFWKTKKGMWVSCIAASIMMGIIACNIGFYQPHQI